MKRRIEFGRLRTRAIFTVAGLLLCAALIIPAVGAVGCGCLNEVPRGVPPDEPHRDSLGNCQPLRSTPGKRAVVRQLGDRQRLQRGRGCESAVTTGRHDALHVGTLGTPALSVSDPNQIHLQDIINWQVGQLHQGPRRGVRVGRRTDHGAVGAPVNGNWYPWGTDNNTTNPAKYVRA